MCTLYLYYEYAAVLLQKSPERAKRRIAALRKNPRSISVPKYASITGFLQALLFAFLLALLTLDFLI